MVSTTVTENGMDDGKVENTSSTGDYRLVGWDVDATGRTLLDEICQIAAYTPNDTFSQYIMPFGDLNLTARRRHNIRVLTIGRYRMLKDMKSGKVLKTKSEISALADFLQWLEKINGDSNQGLILVSHESQKLAPSLLLEALRRYSLLDRFRAVVKGFANGFAVAEVKCAKTVKAFTIRTLSRVLLDKEEDLDSAVTRACLAYQIVQHLLTEERPENKGSGDASVSIVEGLKDFIWPIDKEEENIQSQKKIIEKQNSLRPIFRPMMRGERRDSSRAVIFRRLLGQSGVSFDDLAAAHAKSGAEGIDELIQSKVTSLKPNELAELKKIVNGHFNPENKKKVNEVNKVEGEKSNSDEASVTSTSNTNSSPIKEASSAADSSVTNSPQSNDTSPQKSVNTETSTSSPESKSN